MKMVWREGMGCSRNPAIDAAKLIAALLVIGIHTAIFSDLNGTVYFVFVQIICRTAVPFFAVCTGYFIGIKLSFQNKLEKTKANQAVFFRQWKKTINLYVAWSGLYLLFSIPFWISTGWFSPIAFVDYAFAALTSGSHYHLWYLLYLLYSLPMAYLLLRWVSQRHQRLLIGILWAIAIVSYTYKSFLTEHLLDYLEPVERFSMLPVLLPLLLTGVSISKEAKKSKWIYVVGFLVSSGLLFAEALLLRYLGIEKVSYIIFTLPTAYFLFHLLLELHWSPNKYNGFLGGISTFVYCVHPMFIETIGRAPSNSLVIYLIVALFSSILGYIYCLIKGKLIKKKDISCFN